MPLLGVLLEVVGGVKSIGRRLRRFRFFWTWCDGWLEVVLLPKLQALIKVGCLRGTTHTSSSWHFR
jgi:hypothetical protein